MPKQSLTKASYQGVILSLLGKGEGSAQWVLVIAKAFGLWLKLSVILRKADSGRSWFCAHFHWWPLQDFGDRNETLAQFAGLHQHGSFPTSTTLEPFFLSLANPQAPTPPGRWKEVNSFSLNWLHDIHEEPLNRSNTSAQEYLLEATRACGWDRD